MLVIHDLRVHLVREGSFCRIEILSIVCLVFGLIWSLLGAVL